MGVAGSRGIVAVLADLTERVRQLLDERWEKFLFSRCSLLETVHFECLLRIVLGAFVADWRMDGALSEKFATG